MLIDIYDGVDYELVLGEISRYFENHCCAHHARIKCYAAYMVVSHGDAEVAWIACDLQLPIAHVIQRVKGAHIIACKPCNLFVCRCNKKDA